MSQSHRAVTTQPEQAPHSQQECRWAMSASRTARPPIGVSLQPAQMRHCHHPIVQPGTPRSRAGRCPPVRTGRATGTASASQGKARAPLRLEAIRPPSEKPSLTNERCLHSLVTSLVGGRTLMSSVQTARGPKHSSTQRPGRATHSLTHLPQPPSSPSPTNTPHQRWGAETWGASPSLPAGVQTPALANLL